MSVQVWVGEIPEHSQEREAIVALARGLARLDDLYLVLANFTVGGQAVDLVIFKRDGGFIIELKHCDGRIVGGVNGKWQAFGSNGEAHIINPDRRNPYNQVISYFYRLSNFLNQHRTAFLSEHKAAEIDFRTCKRLVVISPFVHPESEIVLDWKVDLKGLDELPTYLVTATSSAVDLSEEEMLAIPRLLRCEPWRDVNLLVGEEGLGNNVAVPAAAASPPAAETAVAARPRTIRRPLLLSLAAAGLLLLLALLWQQQAWQWFWPPPTETPTPTSTATVITLPTSDPLPPQTPVPLIERVEQEIRAYSAFANGEVGVVLRSISFYDDRTVLRWTLINYGWRPVRFPLNGRNITVKDNIGNVYLLDDALSQPSVLAARTDERVEGSAVIPRAISPDALTLRIWVNGEPFEGAHVWLANVPGRD